MVEKLFQATFQIKKWLFHFQPQNNFPFTFPYIYNENFQQIIYAYGTIQREYSHARY